MKIPQIFVRLSALARRLLNDPSNRGVIQIFIHDEKRTSCYSLTNYPSFFLPKIIGALWYEVSLFDEKGNVVFARKFKLPKFGSIKFVPGEHCGDRQVPKHGIFQARILGKKIGFLDRYYMKYLGRLTSHFYTLFHDKNYDSMAMVHPQTVAPVPDSPIPSNHWYSQYLIPVKRLEKIEIFQLNPCATGYTLGLALNDMSGNEIAKSEAYVPGFGSRKIEWLPSELPAIDFAYLSSDTLRGNEKPIVFSHYRDGSFTALHS